MTITFPVEACAVTCTWKQFIAEATIQQQKMNERHLLHYSHFRYDCWLSWNPIS